jgi:hypothetical protein
MPPLSILYVRAALVHLALGLTFGGLMLANKGIPFANWLWRLRSAHAEILLVGWLLQFAFGVAFWIAPRFWEKPVRGNVRGAWLALVLLNFGIWLVAAATSLQWAGFYVLLGRLLEVGAAIAFASHLWPRIVSREG